MKALHSSELILHIIIHSQWPNFELNTHTLLTVDLHLLLERMKMTVMMMTLCLRPSVVRSIIMRRQRGCSRWDAAWTSWTASSERRSTKCWQSGVALATFLDFILTCMCIWKCVCFKKGHQYACQSVSQAFQCYSTFQGLFCPVHSGTFPVPTDSVISSKSFQLKREHFP